MAVERANMAGFRDQLKRAATGRFSKRASWLYVSLVNAILALFLIWSWSLYPGEYSIDCNAVSNLGDPFMNPWPGWAVFSFGIITFSGLIVPHAFYLHRRLVTLNPESGRRFIVSSLVGNTGYVGVGVFSEAPATFVPHVIAAVMAFYGLFLAAACSWPPSIALVKRRASGRSRPGYVAMFAFMVFFTAVSISMCTLTSFLTLLRGYWVPGLLSMHFWEWMLVGSLAVHTILLTAILNLNAGAGHVEKG